MWNDYESNVSSSFSDHSDFMRAAELLTAQDNSFSSSLCEESNLSPRLFPTSPETDIEMDQIFDEATQDPTVTDEMIAAKRALTD